MSRFSIWALTLQHIASSLEHDRIRLSPNICSTPVRRFLAYGCEFLSEHIDVWKMKNVRTCSILHGMSNESPVIDFFLSFEVIARFQIYFDLAYLRRKL